MAHSPAHGTPDTDQPAQRQSTFHSLRYPAYRYMWIGQIGAAASMWMEQIARPLLIYQMTESALMLGLLAATRMLPQLIVGIWAGVLADRMDKKQLLGLSQAVTFSMHLLTAVLIYSGVIEVWMVFVTTFVSGSSMAFNQPARQSLIAQIVPRESLQNAVALNSAAINTMRIGGAGLAGLLVAFLTFGDLYLIQALIYVGVLWATFRMVVPKFESKRKRNGMLSELMDGLRYARSDKTILSVLMLSMVIFIWAVPYQTVFIPLLAKEELGIGDSGVGLMIALAGAGALTGSLTIATIGNFRKRGRLMLGIICTTSVSLIVLANAPTIFIAIPALLISGAMQTSYMSLAHTYVLGRTDPELHGRVMSLFSLDRGLVPLGAAIGGALAEYLGNREALMIMGGICLGITLMITTLIPAVRRID